MELPSKISYYTHNKCGITDKIGRSGAAVYLFDDMVLKVDKISLESENEYKMMSWLAGKLPVPEIIECVKTNKLSYLLMSRCTGESACSDVIMSKPQYLTDRLSEVFYRIWEIDCNNCPVNSSLEQKLQQAEYNVSNGLVDVNCCDSDTFKNGRFHDPEELLCWLQSNKPKEVPVVSHGDLCLPNIFFNQNKLSGLIDLGRAGVADKWCDIAICYRSLIYNYNGVYSGVKKFGFDEAYFFDALQIKPDREQIQYYLLLDELF